MDIAQMFNNPLMAGAKKAVNAKGIKFIVVDTSGDKWKGAAFKSPKVVVDESTVTLIKELKESFQTNLNISEAYKKVCDILLQIEKTNNYGTEQN